MHTFFMFGLVSGTGALLGAWGRHFQGGGGKRLWAILCYSLLSVPLLALHIPTLEVFSPIPLLVVTLFFLQMLMHETFGNLWLAVARYSACYAVLAALTGLYSVALTAIPIWMIVRWARSPHNNIEDPHSWFEVLHGGIAGFVFTVTALLGSY